MEEKGPDRPLPGDTAPSCWEPLRAAAATACTACTACTAAAVTAAPMAAAALLPL